MSDPSDKKAPRAPSPHLEIRTTIMHPALGPEPLHVDVTVASNLVMLSGVMEALDKGIADASRLASRMVRKKLCDPAYTTPESEGG